MVMQQQQQQEEEEASILTSILNTTMASSSMDDKTCPSTTTTTNNNFWLWVKLVLVSVVVLVVGTKLVVQLWWKPRKIKQHFENQGIKGPPPRLFLGNLKELVEMMLKASAQPMVPPSHNILPRVLPFYHLWKKIYGSTCMIWFGPTPRLAISDPLLIREILGARSDQYYEKYESHPLLKKLEGNGLISLRGEMWSHRRKMINPIFHLENLKLMIPTIGKSAGLMLDEWSTICKTEGKAEIEVSAWFDKLTEEVITRTIFGGSYEDGKEIYRLQSQQMIFAAESFQKVFIPGYRFFPTKRNREIWRLDKEIQTLLMKLINKKKVNMGVVDFTQQDRRRQSAEHETRMSSSEPRDLLDHLIRESARREKGEYEVSEIVEECKSFFFAGKNTTANVLTWTTVMLAMHPQWQQLAREEVLRVCGSRDTPTKDDVASLKTLNMIVHETLRLYPPAVALIRRSKTEVNLGGHYKIPEGTEFLIPIIAVHHDPNVWGQDVHEFNPARFSKGLTHAAKYPNAFMGFGLGGRQCIGQNLALLQAKLALAMMLQRFTFDISPNYKHAPTVLLLLYPQFGAPVIFRSL